MRTRIKVCCIADPDEAALAVAAGADAVGLVGAMPSGPGPIPDEAIAAIARQVPPPVASVLLTSETNARDIAAHAAYTGVTAVQVVSPIPLEDSAELARRLPFLRWIQVVHVEDASALDLIEPLSAHVGAFLLDSGRPSQSVLGGTGQTHDWDISARFVARSPKPVFLAGGLTPANVGEAIARVRPWGVDLCTGVRTQGRLDPGKLAAFMQAVAAADRAGEA